jgi:hypothetical protein
MSELKQKLVLETATIKWCELQRFFAQGNVLFVAEGEDLVEVAVGFARDDAEIVAALLERGAVSIVSDAQARVWIEQDATVWSVVVAPFVLVQGLK